MREMSELHSIEKVERFIDKHQQSFLYISRTNCSVCHVLLPQVKEMISNYPAIELAHVNAGDLEEIAGHLSIFTVPVLLLYVEGKEIIREARSVQMEQLNHKIRKIYEMYTYTLEGVLTMYTGILLYPRFSEYELSVLLSILKQGRKRIVFIGLDREVVKSEAGLTCTPDVRVEEVDAEALDSIVLPGVEDFQHLDSHSILISFLEKFRDKKVWIGAICSAPYLLAMSGLLDGRKYTTGLTVDQRTFLDSFNKATFIDKPVVVDGTVITAKGAHFIEFAIEFGEALDLEFDSNWYKH